MTGADRKDSGISLRQTAMSGSLWLASQWLLNKVVTAGSMLVIAHFLTPEEFGVAATALAFAALVYVLPLTAMGDVLVARPGRIQRSTPLSCGPWMRRAS